MKKEYLGDSVYAENDGFQLIITTENGAGVTNMVILEPDVYQALLNYMSKCVKNTMGDVPDKE